VNRHDITTLMNDGFGGICNKYDSFSRPEGYYCWAIDTCSMVCRSLSDLDEHSRKNHSSTASSSHQQIHLQILASLHSIFALVFSRFWNRNYVEIKRVMIKKSFGELMVVISYGSFSMNLFSLKMWPFISFLFVSSFNISLVIWYLHTIFKPRPNHQLIQLLCLSNLQYTTVGRLEYQAILWFSL